MGVAQRHARLVLRRRRLPRPATPPSRTGWRWSPTGADLVDVGGESTRPGAQRVARGRGAAPGAARRRGAGGRRRRRQHRHDARRGRSGRARGRRGAGQRRQRWPGRRGMAARRGRRRRRRTSSCTGAGTAPTWPSRAVYDDVVAEVVDELQARLDALERAGVDLEPRRARPGARVRQGRRPQLGAARAPRRAAAGSAARCWSAPPARASSASCCRPRRQPARRPVRARTRRPRCRCWPLQPGRGRSGCTRSRATATPSGGRRCPRSAQGRLVTAHVTDARGRGRGARQPAALRRLRDRRHRPDERGVARRAGRGDGHLRAPRLGAAARPRRRCCGRGR